MKPRLILIPMILIIALFLFTNISYADGKFIPEINIDYPDNPVQRAIVTYRKNKETLIIESTLDGEGRRFGWVVPVPSIPAKFEKTSPGLMKTLSLQSKSEIIYGYGDDIFFLLIVIFLYILCFSLIASRISYFILSMFGCLFLFAILLPNFTAYRGVELPKYSKLGVSVISHKIIGSYETFVLKAKESVDLNKWLDGNDFRKFDGRDVSIINYYIDNKWCFVALKLTRKGGRISTPHPILIEFETDKPVYPMRLTAVPESTLDLELFVISEKESVPQNYDMKKTYCNVFNFKDGKSFPFVGRTLLGRNDEIGHPDSEKIMWDGCVLTRLESKIRGNQMDEDIFISFTDTNPYLLQLYSSSAAKAVGYENVSILLLVGIVVLLIFRKTKFSSRNKILFVNLLILPLLGAIIFIISYKNIGEVIEVKHPPNRHYQNFIKRMPTKIKSIVSSDPSSLVLTDTEYLEWLKMKFSADHGYHLINLFAKKPIILEDSPGNITIDRKEGKIVKIKYYLQNGAPVEIH